MAVGEERCVQEEDVVSRREPIGQKVRAIPSFTIGHFGVCVVVLQNWRKSVDMKRKRSWRCGILARRLLA